MISQKICTLHEEYLSLLPQNSLVKRVGFRKNSLEKRVNFHKNSLEKRAQQKLKHLLSECSEER